MIDVCVGVVVGVVVGGDGTVDLHTADDHRQTIQAADQCGPLAADFYVDLDLPNGVHHGIPLRPHVEEF